jgi:molybdopterin-guanine dinucleotide biosynthesis protein A
MKASIIIPAGGFSRRFGGNKPLAPLCGKPLILHTLDRVDALGLETFVVISDPLMKPIFESILLGRARVLIEDDVGISNHHAKSTGVSKGPLAGILRGLKEAQEELAIVLACDLPFVSKEALGFMLRKTREMGFDALVPRWPNGFIEPLHAVYRIRAFKEAIERSIAKGRMKVSDSIDELRKVCFLEAEQLRKFDPELLTFFNVNTIEEFREAEKILRNTSKMR